MGDICHAADRCASVYNVEERPMSRAELQMRDRIKAVATAMLIRNGYHGFRFRDIADRLKITRTNVHYYFGNKRNLCDEVVIDYVNETIRKFETIWKNPNTTLEEKIIRMMESNRERYMGTNPTGATANAWSLIARMRLDRKIIGKKARDSLAHFSVVLERMVTAGVQMAIRKNEITPEAPVKEITLQLVAIANSADPITQDAGSFARLEELYLAFARIVSHAYGLKKRSRVASLLSA
jgi:TetR/AcrR family transcriptional repressor of nem operon